MDKKEISNWVRQGRHRAKKHNLPGDLQIEQVENIIAQNDEKCAYCGKPFKYVDCIFPIKSQAPFVSSNVTTICQECKDIKGNDDIKAMYDKGKIIKELYVNLISRIVEQNDPRMITYIRLILGITNEEQCDG